jgi:hypothetical protein
MYRTFPPSAGLAGTSSPARNRPNPADTPGCCSNTCSGKAMLFLAGYPHSRRPPAGMSVGPISVRDDQ